RARPARNDDLRSAVARLGAAPEVTGGAREQQLGLVVVGGGELAGQPGGDLAGHGLHHPAAPRHDDLAVAGHLVGERPLGELAVAIDPTGGATGGAGRVPTPRRFAWLVDRHAAIVARGGPRGAGSCVLGWPRVGRRRRA